MLSCAGRCCKCRSYASRNRNSIRLYSRTVHATLLQTVFNFIIFDLNLRRLFAQRAAKNFVLPLPRTCPRRWRLRKQQRSRAHFAAPTAVLLSQLRFENPPSAGSNELSANVIPQVPQIFARLRGCYTSVATIHRFPVLLPVRPSPQP